MQGRVLTPKYSIGMQEGELKMLHMVRRVGGAGEQKNEFRVACRYHHLVRPTLDTLY
jgi:hypothetical protein